MLLSHPATNSEITLQIPARTFMKGEKAALLEFCRTNSEPVVCEITGVKFQSL